MKNIRKSLLFLPILPLIFSCNSSSNFASQVKDLLVSRDNFKSITICENYFSTNYYKEESLLKAKQMYDKITSFINEENYDLKVTKIINSDNGTELTNMYAGIRVSIFESNDFQTSIYVTKDGYTYLTRIHYDALAFNSTSKLYSYLYSYIN